MIRIIDDVTEMMVMFVCMNQGIVQKSKYGSHFTGWWFGRATATFTSDKKTINGVECVRIAFKADAKGDLGSLDVGEAWIAKEQGIVMKDINPSEAWTWEITEIEFNEPALGTFDVPPNFVEVSE